VDKRKMEVRITAQEQDWEETKELLKAAIDRN